MMSNKNLPDNIDQECISICNAINRFPTMRTIESCCGHGKNDFFVAFEVSNLNALGVLLKTIDPDEDGVDGWRVFAMRSNISGSVYFILESFWKWGESYEKANKIAELLNKVKIKTNKEICLEILDRGLMS